MKNDALLVYHKFLQIKIINFNRTYHIYVLLQL